jgi:hypothetical protein
MYLAMPTNSFRSIHSDAERYVCDAVSSRVTWSFMYSISSGRVGVLLAMDAVAEYERDDVAAKRLLMPVLARRTATVLVGANAATPCKNKSDVRNVFIMVSSV